MVNRVTYTGDLGYEIWVPPEYQRALYRRSWAAGADSRARAFRHAGVAQHAAGEEFPTWYREFGPIYGPFEAGLERFVDLGKPEFIGRDAACEERKAAASCGA